MQKIIIVPDDSRSLTLGRYIMSYENLCRNQIDAWLEDWKSLDRPHRKEVRDELTTFLDALEVAKSLSRLHSTCSTSFLKRITGATDWLLSKRDKILKTMKFDVAPYFLP